MKLKLKKFFALIAGILLLASAIYGLIVFGRASLSVLRTLNSELAIAIVAAAATGLVSVVSIVLGRVVEFRGKTKELNREKKVPVYEDLISFMMRLLMGQKVGKAPSEAEIVEFMLEFTQRLMVWGSDEVLVSWVKFRKLALDTERMKSNPMELMLIFEGLVKDIRTDLGHSNTGIGSGDVLSLFVNDLDKHIKSK